MKSATRPIIFGEVLFDIFPDGTEVLGGAPFNVAWHLQAFGQAPLFVSRIGDDPLGHAIHEAMQDWGMDDAGLQVDTSCPTGMVQIDLKDGEPRFDILPARAYDRIDSDSLPQLAQGSLLYHGSLALREDVSRNAFERIRAQSAPRPFVDVNLRPPWWDKARVLDLLDGAAWVKINEHELAALVPEARERAQQASMLQDRFALKTLYVTEGASGAFARTPDGSVLRVAPRGEVRVVDAVGAGDAFASVLILGLLADWPLQSSLDRAQAFASAIVGQRGATVRDRSFYDGFLAAWGL